MALTCHNICPHISTQKSCLVIRPFSKASRLRQKHIPAKKTVLPSFTIRSSFKEHKLVFEDRTNGIVCYTDDSGEIVCEGIDEGPRYQQPIQRKSSNHRDVEVCDFVQQRWNEFVRGSELNRADHKGVAVQGDININGFNTFH